MVVRPQLVVVQDDVAPCQCGTDNYKIQGKTMFIHRTCLSSWASNVLRPVSAYFNGVKNGVTLFWCSFPLTWKQAP